ncbi:MAG: UDP-N-acetylmuramoyl-L-alanyl-D-glutamate--2,6-diaminopimelate ligase, partial [Chlorobia bacterium]|nr:UDP-N-acetylmuramoyl-L-alanyl-D-glutamate--2,6-diaminopimelate ligase [Fimbriimonadaceae bacterium]
MTLSALLSESGVQPIATSGDAEISSITQDSREAKPGSLFVCNPGTTNDSHAFIASAKRNGAVAAVVWSPEGLLLVQADEIAGIQLPKDRILFNDGICKLCNTFFAYPTRSMKVIGVTGTNGKT